MPPATETSAYTGHWVAFILISGLFGFAFPPLWIGTLFCLWALFRDRGVARAARVRGAEGERMRAYLGWGKR